ncbi:hypothetical protein [Candidatus Villigracilis proximus]|uniref:hypothetical protein n=1 Tax=Candidatus Villigracilis proximus TaxID=3140683 RepID=UPI0031EC3F10
MRKLIVHQFISLDGVIQAPGGVDEDTDGGFTHGGWTIPFWHDDIGMRFSQAMETADTLCSGAKHGRPTAMPLSLCHPKKIHLAMSKNMLFPPR